MFEKFIGKRVIVRADKPGVFYGTLAAKEGREILLTNARKLHYWDGAAAVEEISKIGTKIPENCRFTVFVDDILLSDYDQILLATKQACESIEGVKEWKA